MAITHSMLMMRKEALKKKRFKKSWGWALVVCLSVGAAGIYASISGLMDASSRPLANMLLAAGFVAGAAGIAVGTWYKKAKDEYDRVRLWMMARLGQRVCDCSDSCDCREAFMRECKEKYDVNLYYK